MCVQFGRTLGLTDTASAPNPSSHCCSFRKSPGTKPSKSFFTNQSERPASCNRPSQQTVVSGQPLRQQPKFIVIRNRAEAAQTNLVSGGRIENAEGRCTGEPSLAFRGGVVLRSTGVVDLLAVRPGNHAVGAGCPDAASRPGLARGAIPSPPQPRRAYRMCTLSCRFAGHSNISLPRLSSGDRHQPEAAAWITSRIYVGTKSCMCALSLRTQRDHV